MTIVKSAEMVLQKVGRPLKFAELANRMLDIGWTTTSHSPVVPIRSVLYSDMQNKGERSIFVKVAPGTIDLRNRYPSSDSLSAVASPETQKQVVEDVTTTNKTITITIQQDQWINTHVSAGHFSDHSDYIRNLIHRDQSQLDDIGILHSELIKGEQSGEPELFDAEQFKKRMAFKYVK